MAKPQIKGNGRTITVRVPISIRKRGGRKVVLAPDGSKNEKSLLCRRVDNAMVKAIARAFRWRNMLENGECATIKEIAAREAINESYIARVLRLSLLAPNIVESIIGANSSRTPTLSMLMRPFPALWTDQNRKISTSGDI